jgi:hypothetical protein
MSRAAEEEEDDNDEQEITSVTGSLSLSTAVAADVKLSKVK